MRTFYEITLRVEVTDPEALKAHAFAVAHDNKLSSAEYADLRRDAEDGVASDLQMIFDPGASPPGTSIEESMAVKFAEAICAATSFT